MFNQLDRPDLHVSASRRSYSRGASQNSPVIHQVLRANPAVAVRGPKCVVTKGPTPALTPAETRMRSRLFQNLCRRVGALVPVVSGSAVAIFALGPVASTVLRYGLSTTSVIGSLTRARARPGRRPRCRSRYPSSAGLVSDSGHSGPWDMVSGRRRAVCPGRSQRRRPGLGRVQQPDRHPARQRRRRGREPRQCWRSVPRWRLDVRGPPMRPMVPPPHRPLTFDGRPLVDLGSLDATSTVGSLGPSRATRHSWRDAGQSASRGEDVRRGATGGALVGAGVGAAFGARGGYSWCHNESSGPVDPRQDRVKAVHAGSSPNGFHCPFARAVMTVNRFAARSRNTPQMRP